MTTTLSLENHIKIGHIESMCVQYIGPRKYWLHYALGGDGWRIEFKYDTSRNLIINDDSMATFIQLKL